MDFDIDSCEIEASKHFKNKWMRKWDWDYAELRDAIRGSEVVKKGAKKYEAFNRSKSGSRKIIFAYYKEWNALFVISGAEG